VPRPGSGQAGSFHLSPPLGHQLQVWITPILSHAWHHTAFFQILHVLLQTFLKKMERFSIFSYLEDDF
jgi:hypothetical protein